jgi:hypothetical protein
MDGSYSPVSKGTVTALEYLLDQAKQGQLIGIAFAGILRGRRPINGFSGYASQDPHFAMGVVRELNEVLLEQARKKYS